MSTRRRTLFLGAAFAALLLTPLTPAASAEGAVVIHHVPGCIFEPGDVPGVNVFFPPKSCMQVITPSGRVTVIAKALLPAGFTLQHTFVGTLPCFGHTGRVVATKSGRVSAICHWQE
jgi:hypothetical protein